MARINELAHELKVKAKVILGVLPPEWDKRHSSEIPDDTADQIRKWVKPDRRCMSEQLLLPDQFVYTKVALEVGRIVEFDLPSRMYIIEDEKGGQGLLARDEFILSAEAEPIVVQEARVAFYRRELMFGRQFPDMSQVEFGSDEEARAARNARRNFLASFPTVFKPKDLGADFTAYLKAAKDAVVFGPFSFPLALADAVHFGLRELGAKIDPNNFRPIVYGARKAGAVKRWSVGAKIKFPRPIDLNIIPEEIRALLVEENGILTCQSWRVALGIAIMLDLLIWTHKREVVDTEPDPNQSSFFSEESELCQSTVS